MKRFMIFLFSISLSLCDCYSQNDWNRGFIIRNTGDTINGFIDNRDSKSNSIQCYFRKEIIGKTTIYKPTEILGFRFVDGKYFISKKVALEDSITVFLEYVLHGKINVYHYKDERDCFFIEKDGIVYALKNTTQTQDKDGKLYELDKNEYLGVLTYLMQDANMQSNINDCKLTTNSLINVAKNYHNRVCSGEQCIIYSKNILPVQAQFGLYIGTSVNSFNFGKELISKQGLSFYLGSRFEFQNLFNWAENVSISVDFIFQKYTKYNLRNLIDRKLIRYNNIDYLITNDTTKWQYAYNSKKNIPVDLQLSVLKIPLTFNYTFSKGNFRPYINFGAVNTIVLSQNNNFINYTFQNEFNHSIPLYWLGFIGRMGGKYMINKHYIFMDFNLEYSQSLNTNQFLRLSNNHFSITTGYSF